MTLETDADKWKSRAEVAIALGTATQSYEMASRWEEEQKNSMKNMWFVKGGLG